MKPCNEIDPALLRQLLRYEPNTGKLFWLPRPAEMFAAGEPRANIWNGRYAYSEALAVVHPRGYRAGSVLGHFFLAHRVVWAMQTGSWPVNEIDHRDLDRSNNRWTNLREATDSENACNQGIRSTNTSGAKGVSWDKRRSVWRVQITHLRKVHYVGQFAAVSDAAAAYARASEKLHGNFGRPA